MTSSQPTSSAYRGRFAPSPTGPLHFGSLVAAVGSYLEARSRHGEWFVRIENLDPLREISAASGEILSMLDALGMEWDGEVVYQNQRHKLYKEALATLERQDLIYTCTCSRKEIADSTIMGIDGPIYPGTCRGRSLHKGRAGARRLRTDNKPVEFNDALQGRFRQRLESTIGDFVLQRADGVFAYQLAVVVDDAEQGVTHVVRGEDLLGSTPRQIYLQQLLGYAIPSYLHLPIVVNALGEKLSKQTGAAQIDASDPVLQLITAVRFLGQRPPAELINEDIASFWKWATENWKQEMIPRRTPEIC